MTKYARQCTKTLEGMNEGWVVGDGEEYYKYEADILARCKEAGYDSLDEAYDDDFMYHTEWEEDDYEFVEIDGVVREIGEVIQADETLGVAGIVSHDQLDTQEYNRLLKVLGVDGMLMVFERWMSAEDLKSVISSAKDTLTDNGIPLPLPHHPPLQAYPSMGSGCLTEPSGIPRHTTLCAYILTKHGRTCP